MAKSADGLSSRSQNAYNQLKEEIARGRVARGQRLRELEIAARLGISRTPVREALQRLQADGLVKHVPHIGAVVAELDHQAIIELYEMREVLEGTAARNAARRASDAEVQELADLVAHELDYSQDPEALARLNRAFHAALYQAGHNRFLLQSLGALSNAMVLLGPTTLSVENRSVTAHDEHLTIVRAVAARNPDEAEEAARLHIRNAQ